jgi:hypothetical protein
VTGRELFLLEHASSAPGGFHGRLNAWQGYAVVINHLSIEETA